MVYTNNIDSFISAIQDTGIKAPETVVADGQFHRFSSNGKPNDKAGYYILFSNPNGLMAGIFGCWRLQEEHRWSSKSKSTLSLEDKLTIQQLQEKAKARLQEKAKLRSDYAASIIKSAEPAKPDHAYAKRKNSIPTYGALWKNDILCSEFFDSPESTGKLKDVLIIPLYDKEGSVISVQAITGDGSKFFMSGGLTKGGMFTFKGETDNVYIVEGYATAATVFDATGKTVVCAFNANNLLVVAPIVKELFPDSKIIVAADNDAIKESAGKGNKGKAVAEKLFESEALPYSMPTFDSIADGTDWNDYACIHGNESVTKALSDNLVEPIKPSESFEEALELLRKEPDNSHIFKEALKHIDEAEILLKSRMKKQLKELTGVPFKDMNTCLAEMTKAKAMDELSHGDITRKFVDRVGETELVGAYGSMWTYNPDTGLWSNMTLQKLSTKLPYLFNEQVRCQRVPDYRVIASHIYDLKEEQGFFENAPLGVNTPDGFLCVQESQVVLEEANPLHRARHRLNFNPAEKDAKPKAFLKMLEEAFADCYPDEQIRQLRMGLGLSMFGMMPQLQKAIFLYGAAGSGKSVIIKVIESMVPEDASASVSPFEFDDPYQRAALAGKRFNFVPEMEKDKFMPSSQFKAIVGGDKVGAREPHGKVFTHTPCAANLFSSNHRPKTKDHSEGYYRRLYIFHFKNTKPESERDPGLLDLIISEELPAILRWLIEGVEDYLSNGLYISPAHSDCLVQWKSEGNSVQGWLDDREENGIKPRLNGEIRKPLKLSEGYEIYRNWCSRSGISPYKKTDFIQHMETLGYIISLNCGYRVFSNLSPHLPVVLSNNAA